jgi:hypothetical protein
VLGTGAETAIGAASYRFIVCESLLDESFKSRRPDQRRSKGPKLAVLYHRSQKSTSSIAPASDLFSNKFVNYSQLAPLDKARMLSTRPR